MDIWNTKPSSATKGSSTTVKGLAILCGIVILSFFIYMIVKSSKPKENYDSPDIQTYQPMNLNYADMTFSVSSDNDSYASLGYDNRAGTVNNITGENYYMYNNPPYNSPYNQPPYYVNN